MDPTVPDSVPQLSFVQSHERVVDAVRVRVGAFADRIRVPRVRFSRDLPVFITCRDRVSPLRQLLQWLDSEGMENVVLVDNDSTYPPLLELFDTTRHRVLRLGRNEGHTAPWSPEALALRTPEEAFVVTDPDIIPVPEAHGAVEYLVALLNRHRRIVKAALGLVIDDLPASFEGRDAVLRWEKRYWRHEVAPGVFSAPVDTTFAVYRPGTMHALGPALRTGGRYVARHEPWYVDSTHPTAEAVFYHRRASGSATWGLRDEHHAMYGPADGEP